MKIVLWILVGLGALAVVVVVALFLIGRSVSQKAEDAKKFAENATQADCADEVAKRANACDDMGVSCVMEISLFATGCFSGAQAAAGEEFCAGVPAADDKGGITAWSESFCPPRNLPETKCGFVAGLLAGMCGAAQGTPAGEGEGEAEGVEGEGEVDGEADLGGEEGVVESESEGEPAPAP